MNRRDGKSMEVEAAERLTSSALYEGDVWLEIKSLEDSKQIEQFIDSLRLFENIRLESFGWSENEGVIVVVSLQSPLPLGDMLSQMPMIEQVYQKRQKNHISI